MKHKWEAISLIFFFAIMLGYAAYDEHQEQSIIEACVAAGSEWTDVNEGIGVTMGCVRP